MCVVENNQETNQLMKELWFGLKGKFVFLILIKFLILLILTYLLFVCVCVCVIVVTDCPPGPENTVLGISVVPLVKEFASCTC